MTTQRFEVDSDVDVYAQDGVTVVGSLSAGVIHEGERLDEHWLMIRPPDGEPGYVRARNVRVVAPEVPGEAPAVPKPQLPPAASAPPESERTGGPRLRRSSLLVSSVAVVAALVGGVFVAASLGRADGSDTRTTAVVPERPLAVDLTDVLDGFGLAPVTERDFVDELFCEPWPALPGVAIYDGRFGVRDFFGGTVGATVTCNTLSIEVVDGELVGLRGLFAVEDFQSELEVDDASSRVTGTLCRSDVFNYFELESVAGDHVGPDAMSIVSVDISVAIGVEQTLGEPERPDVSCDERLASQHTKIWSAQVSYDDFSAAVSFVDDFGDEVGSVLLGRRG
jgi:hypothetical protein